MAVEIEQTSIPPTRSFTEAFGSDIGDNKVVKIISGIGGAVAGGFIGNAIGKSHTIQTGNPLAMCLGAVIGSVAAYKAIPEIATDIQRGNQAVDQQVAAGESEGNLADRFSAVWDNIVNLGGQTNVPTINNNLEIE